MARRYRSVAHVYDLHVTVVQIDGLSGSGKSTLCTELSRRGLCAVDSDTEFAYFGDPVTGRPTDVEIRANWIWDVAKLRAFCRRRRRATLFICGGAMNQDQCADLFAFRFRLRIDDETMRNRLLERSGNDYGKDPAELAEQLELNRHESQYESPGWIALDATRPVGEVADKIIELVGADSQDDTNGPRTR
jgi:hypothetical protein